MSNKSFNSSSQAIIHLASRIEAGEITSKKVAHELKEIGSSYEYPFLATVFEKKPKPWDKEYLTHLRNSVAFGKTSPEFFMYFAEVADTVYRPKRIIKTILSVAAMIAAIAVLTAIFCLYF